MSSNSDLSKNFDDENFYSSITSPLSNISSLDSYSIIDEANANSSGGLSASLAEENRAIDNYISNNQNTLNNLDEPNSSTEQDDNSLVFQSSDSLERGIINGDFSKSDPTANDFGWNTEGMAYVESGRGVLTEGSAFLSGFDQTFTISEDARSLQFTLVDSDLGDNSFAPPDALEIALLDADTSAPLTGTHSLGDTDAFFNLQNDGTAYFSDRVRIGGTTSGDTINLDNSHTVSVDISHLSAGTEATLYFDLLSFGAVDSQILIDDVLLTDSSLATPIAVDDSATLNQGKTATIDVLANDSDSDGTIIPASLQIQTQPINGTAILLPDGRVSYLPDSGFAGSDSFTYIVQDNDGQSSNPATVDITVNNVAPTIENIELPDTIIEGTEITLSAIASDPGSDELTYTWEISDRLSVTSDRSTVDQTFIDNGIYNATLTVSDPYGGTDSQTFDITVDNAAPTVDAGEDRTIDEGETVTLSGTYSDLGVNDTHTTRWEFDDGTIIEGQTAQRSYNEPGAYTATFTVTDNDGASTSQTINITVNNTAPVITTLTGDTNISEGDTATFNAVATDSGNGELSYTWDFGDGSEQLSGNGQQATVTHEYTDNGNYTVILTVEDETGASSTQTLDIVVNNVAPAIASIDGATNVNEGETVTYTASVSDPGDDELTYNWTVNGELISNESDPETIDYTFADNGNYNLSLTVTDDDGAATTYELEILVDNVAPTINITSEITGNEGEAIAFDPSISDPGNDTLTVTLDFGDSSEPITVSSEELPITHTYTDNGNYTATITVIDDDGATTNQTIDVTINNTAPVITTLTGDTEINEGESATFNAIATDSGNDTLTYTWDFGDGTPQETGNGEQGTVSVNHQYLDNGSYTVTLTVADEEGDSVSSTLDVTVNNLAPTIAEITGETNILEGTEVTYSATATDPGDDTLTYSWDFGDGNTALGQDVTHTFADNGNYTITLTVSDDDNASSTQTLNVTVNNVAPTIDEIIGETNVNEGQEITYTAIASDRGNDTLTYTWNFGDGSESIEGENVAHTFIDNGNYTVTLTVSDDDGAATTSTLDVTVNNVAPTILEIIGDTEVKEGELINYSATASDSGNDTLTYSWDFGDGSEIQQGVDVTHTFTDNGNYTVTLTVTDDDGATATSTLEVVVNNVAPVITEIVGETEVSEGEEINYSAIASDAGNDTLTYSWDFGDGSDSVIGESVTHAFTDNGNYTVTLTVTDDDGATATSTLEVVVNNVAPVITEIVGETEVSEGEEVTYSAIASDGGDDTLTYTWDFGDGSDSVIGESVNHIFADNGDYTITLTVSDDDGATASSTIDVVVENVSPTINEIIGDSNVNEGEEVTYSATATDPGDDTLTYTWNFGDGSDPIIGDSITHVFTDDGVYAVALTVTDSDGASTTQTIDVTVNNVAPTITEILGDTEVNEGQEISYRAIASDDGDDTLTYTWDFGDGSESIEGENVTHTFTDNGNYTITLTVTDDDGAATNSTLDVTVNNLAPVIIEIVGETEVLEGDEVTYSAIASDSGNDTLTYSWDFGDGSIAEGIDVTHIFANNGNYTIALTVTDDDGASTTSTIEIIVNNVAPTITEILGNTEVSEGEEATYSAIASDAGNDTLTYSWDFGDGSESVEGESLTHVFTDNGEYTITLTVTDSDGAATSSTIDVTVNNLAPVITEIVGDTNINEGQEVSYSAIASEPGNDTLTYNWDFGDGSTAIGTDVIHTFTDNGNYTITLTVGDDDGATATSTIDVTVNNVAPTITEIIGNTEVNEGEEVTYSAIASDSGNDTLSYNWNFGDGSETVEGATVTHTFTDNGNYTITLTVTDDDGASTSFTEDIAVNNVAPTVTEIIGNTEVSEGEEVTYSAIASDAGNDTLTYNWDFGDGVIASGEFVTHTFTDNGSYTITLTVRDDDGATATQTLDVLVSNVAPVIDEIIGSTNVNEGEEVSYTAIANDSGNDTLTYSWNFGDGVTAIGENVTHTFSDDGNYTVTLTVTDDDGATATSTLDVVVNNLPPVITSFTGDSEIDEGEVASFGVTATDEGNDTLTYAWDFGDGGETVEGESVDHLFVDNGLYNVSVTVTDDDGSVATQSLTITVNNVTPVIDPWSDRENDEGEEVRFSATFSDPGRLDNHTVEWNFGDGSEIVTETINSSQLTTYNLEQTHTYTDDGIYTATLTITDSDGAVATNTMTVTVNNTAPAILNLTGDTNVLEGASASFRADATDGGNDTLIYNWDFGDGSTAVGTDVTHIFSDNGEYTVTLTVTDDDGAATASTIDVTVNNVAPSIDSLNGDTNVNEGEVANFNAVVSDPGSDVLTYSWDFGDGSESLSVTSEQLPVTHTYTDNGNYTVTLTVTDDDGAATTSTIDVTVNNVAPSITNINYGEINEGVSTQFSADATDPGDDTLTYTWDFGDGSEPVTGRDVSHLFTDNGDYTITLTVSDEDGGSTSSQTTITAQEVFNIKAEGTVRINGSSDLDGEPLNFDDDTRIYAGEGFIINGNQTLPVQRDSDGNPIQIGRKSVLIDRAVTVGPNYTQSKANASRRRYANLIPPQVIDELSVNVPSHDELVSSQLALLQSEGSTEITFNPQQNPINNVNDWNNYFPNNSNAAEPTIVRINNGNLNIPGSVNISNYVFVLDNGNINFNGSGHTLDNTALILNNGSINLASVQSRNLTVLASGAINMNGGARFAGDSLIATGNSNGSINFNGTTVNNEPSYLRVISQGNIIFNGSSTTIGEFLARKNFTANGSSSIVGSVQTKGDIRFNGSATISSFS